MDPLSAASAIASLVLGGGRVAFKAHELFDRFSDCPTRVRNIGTDIDNTISVLMQLNAAFGNPAGSGVFGLQGMEEQFNGVMKGLQATLDELSEHIDKYKDADKSAWKKGKWAAFAMEEAGMLSGELARHKDSLGIILQLTQCAILARVDSRGADHDDVLRTILSQIVRIQSTGTGATDPRLSLWLDTVAELASSAALDDTVTVADWTPRVSYIPLIEGENDTSSKAELTHRESLEQKATQIQQLEAQLARARHEMEQMQNEFSNMDQWGEDAVSRRLGRLTLPERLGIPSEYEPVVNELDVISTVKGDEESGTDDASMMPIGKSPNTVHPRAFAGMDTTQEARDVQPEESEKQPEQEDVVKSFRVSMDDPYWKVLPAALTKYNINRPAEDYILLIVYKVDGVEKDRPFEANELPLRIFRELHKQGRKPMFMLRKKPADLLDRQALSESPGVPLKKQDLPGPVALEVSMDDPCWKILPAALKKYNITAAPGEKYDLWLYHKLDGVDEERPFEQHELPLRIFKELEKQGRDPMFMLRKRLSAP